MVIPSFGAFRYFITYYFFCKPAPFPARHPAFFIAVFIQQHLQNTYKRTKSTTATRASARRTRPPRARAPFFRLLSFSPSSPSPRGPKWSRSDGCVPARNRRRRAAYAFHFFFFFIILSFLRCATKRDSRAQSYSTYSPPAVVSKGSRDDDDVFRTSLRV